MKPLKDSFQNFKHLRNRLTPYREIATREITQNEYVYAICCRLKVDDDVIFGRKYSPGLRGVNLILKVLALVHSEILPKRIIL